MRSWLALALCLLGPGAAQAADMIALRYIDQDPGDPPYLTRILVTPDFMRMDGGADGDDFVLLDRRQRRVINVLRESKLALVFVPGELPPRPADWQARLDVQQAGPGVQRFSLSVKAQVCSEGSVTRKVAADAARALAELKAILAATQYRTWQQSPQELRHECDLANLVWETGTVLKLGLPLEEREFTGRTRRFEGETREPLQPELFRVPEGVKLLDAPS